MVTEGARDILRSLHLIHEGNGARFTLISGLPVCGKTMSLKQFSANESNLDHIAFKSGENKPSDVSEVHFRHFLPWENPNGRSIPLRRERLMNHIAANQWRARHTSLADEAQHLSAGGVAWLRGLAEETGTFIAFAGDIHPSVPIEPIPQLRSRMIRQVVMKGLPGADISTMAALWGVSDNDVLSALHAAAKQHGALRNISHVLSLALDFAGGSIISRHHLCAAIVDLKRTTRLMGASDAGHAPVAFSKPGPLRGLCCHHRWADPHRP